MSTIKQLGLENAKSKLRRDYPEAKEELITDFLDSQWEKIQKYKSTALGNRFEYYQYVSGPEIVIGSSDSFMKGGAKNGAKVHVVKGNKLKNYTLLADEGLAIDVLPAGSKIIKVEAPKFRVVADSVKLSDVAPTDAEIYAAVELVSITPAEIARSFKGYEVIAFPAKITGVFNNYLKGGDQAVAYSNDDGYNFRVNLNVGEDWGARLDVRSGEYSEPFLAHVGEGEWEDIQDSDDPIQELRSFLRGDIIAIAERYKVEEGESWAEINEHEGKITRQFRCIAIIPKVTEEESISDEELDHMLASREEVIEEVTEESKKSVKKESKKAAKKTPAKKQMSESLSQCIVWKGEYDMTGYTKKTQWDKDLKAEKLKILTAAEFKELMASGK